VRYTKQMFTALALLMTPLLASAQFSHTASMATQVPFDFVVGDRVVPAGKCVLQAANTAAHTIVIRNDDTRVRLFSSLSTDETPTAPATDQLLFRKYGSRYFLAAIRLEGSRVMYQIPESKEEAGLRLRSQPSLEETIHAF
jgi:hypothetical protein